MDCLIPGPNVRPFCAAIGCLSRMGKELYIEFDAVDGLTLRTLNDSKSVYSSFQYEPSFFQRCSVSMSGRKRRVDEEDSEESRYSVRISMKSLNAIVRPRKGVLSLQLSSTGDYLSFEFQLQRSETKLVRVIHRVGVATAQSVDAVTAMDGSSEMVLSSQLVQTMLEPLKRAPEIALVVNDTYKLVSSVSFAQDDIPQPNNNTVNLTKPAPLKTETSVGYDDLNDMHYVSRYPNWDAEDPIPPPDTIHEQVVLVFSLKEFKSMLQFCSQAYQDQELPITVSFFWGGKPMVVKASAEGFSAQLVTATLNHKLLGDMRTSTMGGGAQ